MRSHLLVEAIRVEVTGAETRLAVAALAAELERRLREEGRRIDGVLHDDQSVFNRV